MNTLHKIHRILGSLLSILFFIWFASGFVMIYHNFPRITDTERHRGLTPLDTPTLVAAQRLLQRIPSGTTLESVALTASDDGRARLVFTADGRRRLLVDGRPDGYRFTVDELIGYARRINPEPIVRIDTIRRLDRWLTYDRDTIHFPVYKFYYADPARSELYVSSLTGEGLQYTHADSRFWAWVGAIPHWMYLFNLRHYTGAWRLTVIILSGVGTLMCLTGIAVGIRAMRFRYRQRRQLGSPYRKPLYRWHHLAGLFFGLFACTFAFSGMMSLQKVPQWLIPTHRPDLQKSVATNPLPIDPEDYPIELSLQIGNDNRPLRKIEWAAFGTKPLFRLVIGDTLRCIDASSHLPKPLHLAPDEATDRIRTLLPDAPLRIELLTEYDNYYIHKRMHYPLPVYRIDADDADRSLFYIDPLTADVRYFNANTRARKWMYQALHSFSVKPLLERPLLWHILMFTSMTGGTVISVTGLWLSYRYVRRQIRKRKR